jgi:hypothetical protein
MKRALIALGLALSLTLAARPARAEEQPRPERDPVLELSIAPELGFRKLTWNDRVTSTLVSFTSGTMALACASLTLFPFANHGLPVVSHLGFFGSSTRSLRGQAPDASGAEFSTLWHQWELGGEWRASFLGRDFGALSLRYGSLRYDIGGLTGPGVLLPTGTKQYWRPGFDFRLPLPLGQLGVSVSAGYLAVVVTDAVSRAFPRSTTAGVDLGLHVEWLAHPHLTVRLSGGYTRFFYSLHPLPGDPYVAGGALDELAVADLAAIARF